MHAALQAVRQISYYNNLLLINHKLELKLYNHKARNKRENSYKCFLVDVN